MYVSCDIELKHVPMNFISFKTKCNIIVPISVFLDLVLNLFACFHIGTFSFVFRTYTDTTYKPAKWMVFRAAQRRKTGYTILAFSILMSAARLWQEPCEYLDNLEDFSNSVTVPMKQEWISLFVCLFVKLLAQKGHLFIYNPGDRLKHCFICKILQISKWIILYNTATSSCKINWNTY